MIFCTVGTQAPFDRFVRVVDEAAGRIDEEVVAQVRGGSYVPRNLRAVGFLPPDEFDALFASARLIVAHAGMGTILSAMRLGKPIVVFPRVAALGEHRNEHQLATARKMKELGYVYVAETAEELLELLSRPDLKPLHAVGPRAASTLVAAIRRDVG